MFGGVAPRSKGSQNLFHLVPVNVQLTSLTAADDIAQVLMPGSGVTYTIQSISAACRLLTSGTATVVVKNAAGSTLTSINLVADAVVAGVLSIGTIAAGDKLRIGLSGVGVGLADVTVTAWIKMPATA